VLHIYIYIYDISSLRVNVGGVDVLRTFNSEHKCRVTLLTREEWIREPGIPSAVKGRMGPGCWGDPLSVQENVLRCSRQSHMLSWHAFMKFR